MNGKKTEKLNKDRRGLIRTGITAGVLLAVLALSITVEAWFALGRRAAGVTEIEDPTVIFIKTGNEEDIRYLNLGGIDVDMDGIDNDPGYTNKKYKDFVFCVMGNNVTSYKMQLAYTTNNQFEYEVYRATETTSSTLSGSDILVDYNSHPAQGSPTTYYYAVTVNNGNANGLEDPIIRTSADNAIKIGTNLNRNNGASEILAYQENDQYLETTYEGYDVYHKYAVPIYWQTADSESTNLDSEGNFTSYFILRVIWDKTNAKNDKETDIIYISARNTST